MPEALRLLIWLQFKASLRQMYRGLKTPKGAVIGMIVLASMGFMCIPLITSVFAPKVDGLSSIENIERFVPLALFGYLIMALFTSMSTESITFSQEEIENLFTAPFTRRQLLVYKIQGMLRVALFTSLFMAITTSIFVPSIVRSFFGIYMTMLFTIFVPMLLTLVGQIGSTQLFNRRRKIAGLVLIAILAFAMLQGARQVIQSGFSWADLNQWVTSATDSTAGTILLAPFKVFSNTIFAKGFDVSFFGNLGIALAINSMMLFLIFRMDANYLAVVERTSFRLAALQRNVRTTGGMAWSTRKEYSSTFPMLPFWNGMGPVVWRQLLVTFRLTKWLVAISLILMCAVAVPILLEAKEKIQDEPAFPLIALMGIGYMSMFFSLSAPVGFRPDLHRMEVFKCLPLSNATIALGQLLGSVIILVVVQVTIIALFAAFSPNLLWIWGIAFVAILPINFLAMAVTNTMSLLVPVKIATGTKDISAIGQGILSMFALIITLALVMSCIFGLAALCYLYTSNWVATVAVGISIAIAFCIASGFALVSAYKRFDVSLNTPA